MEAKSEEPKHLFVNAFLNTSLRPAQMGVRIEALREKIQEKDNWVKHDNQGDEQAAPMVVFEVSSGMVVCKSRSCAHPRTSDRRRREVGQHVDDGNAYNHKQGESQKPFSISFAFWASCINEVADDP